MVLLFLFNGPDLISRENRVFGCYSRVRSTQSETAEAASSNLQWKDFRIKWLHLLTTSSSMMADEEIKLLTSVLVKPH